MRQNSTTTVDHYFRFPSILRTTDSQKHFFDIAVFTEL